MSPPLSGQPTLDHTLGIQAYQQTSTELTRLGCLLAVFLPFELASRLLQQLSGIVVSDVTIWQWVSSWTTSDRATQTTNPTARKWEFTTIRVARYNTMPLVIAADGVTVPSS